MAEELFGDISEIESDKVAAKRFGRLKVAVIKHDDSYYAFKNECTHVKVTLTDGILCDKTIECTMHGAKFDFTTGDVLKAPATQPLEVYKTRVEGSSLFVEIPD